ncbi:MAG: hypothetical protein V1702_00315 [Candidatus Woesearchaeota archaeon]
MPRKRPNFKDLHSSLWSQFTFLAQQRQLLDQQIQYLFAFNTLFLVIYFQLFKEKLLGGNSLFFIPLLFLLLIPTAILLYNYTPRAIWWPFIDKETLKEIYIQGKDYYEQLVRSIYGTVPGFYHYREFKRGVLKGLLNSILVGILLTFTVILIDIREYGSATIMAFILAIGLIFLNKMFLKEYSSSNPAPEVEKFFDDWLKQR